MRTLMISYLQNVHSDPCISFLMVAYWHLTVCVISLVGTEVPDVMWMLLWCWANKLNNSWREKGKQFLFVLWITQKIHPVGINLTSFCIHPSLSNYQECKYPTWQHTIAWTSYNKTFSAYSNESFGTSSWETVDNSTPSSIMQSYYVECESFLQDCSIHFRRSDFEFADKDGRKECISWAKNSFKSPSRLSIEIYSWPKSATLFCYLVLIWSLAVASWKEQELKIGNLCGLACVLC